MEISTCIYIHIEWYNIFSLSLNT